MVHAFQAGDRVGRFRIDRLIAAGGMGTVYRATDPVLGRPVAIKVVATHLQGDPTALARFQREATSAANLKHPGIATVYETGEVQGLPYIALEFVDGRSLASVDPSTPRPLEETLALLEQAAEALDYAHARGVFHRDIKPSNIMVREGDGRVVLVDFGLAYAVGSPALTTGVIGTPRYMAPEQFRGGRIDARSDVYALAIVGYELLTGQVPFDGATPVEVMQRQLNELPAPPSELNPALGRNLDAAILQALAKDPAERYPTATAFCQALRGAPSSLIAPRRTVAATGGGSLRPGARSRVRLWLVASAVVLALAVGLSLAAWIATPDSGAEEMPADGLVPSAADGDWPTASGDAAQTWDVRTGFQTYSNTPLWTVEVGEGATEPVIGGGKVVLGSSDGRLRAYAWESGRLSWQTVIGDGFAGAPAILERRDGESLVFAPDADGDFFGLSLSTGRTLWKRKAAEMGGPAVGGMTVAKDSTIWVATVNGLLRGLSPDGRIVLSSDLSQYGGFVARPSVTTGAVLLSSGNGLLVSVDIATGDAAWTAKLAGTPSTAPLVAEPVSLVFVGTTMGLVRGFSIASGREIWQASLGAEVVGLAFDGQYLYATARDGTLHVWMAATGKSRWIFNGGVEAAVQPLTDGKLVLLATKSGAIRFVDATSGKERDDLLLQQPSPATYPRPAGGWLFVGGSSLTAFRQ